MQIDLDFGDLENCFKIKTKYHIIFFEDKQDYINLINDLGEEKVEGLFDNCEYDCDFIYVMDYNRKENYIYCNDWLDGATTEDPQNMDCFFTIAIDN